MPSEEIGWALGLKTKMGAACAIKAAKRRLLTLRGKQVLMRGESGARSRIC